MFHAPRSEKRVFGLASGLEAKLYFARHLQSIALRRHRLEARGRVFAKLWADKKYQRIQAFKDAALRAWNIADAYKSRTSGGLEKAAKADARVKRALSRMYAAERVALEKAGLSY